MRPLLTSFTLGVFAGAGSATLAAATFAFIDSLPIYAPLLTSVFVIALTSGGAYLSTFLRPNTSEFRSEGAPSGPPSARTLVEEETPSVPGDSTTSTETTPSDAEMGDDEPTVSVAAPEISDEPSPTLDAPKPTVADTSAAPATASSNDSAELENTRDTPDGLDDTRDTAPVQLETPTETPAGLHDEDTRDADEQSYSVVQALTADDAEENETSNGNSNNKETS